MNKRKLIIAALISSLTLSACSSINVNINPNGSSKEDSSAEDAGGEASGEAVIEIADGGDTPDTDAGKDLTEGGFVGMANPWRDITEEEALKDSVRLFKAPEGAENVCWRILDSAADDKTGKGPLIELDFDIPDEYQTLSFTARYQYGADEDGDISGMFYEWTVTDDGTLANWGMGNMPARFYRSINDQETADLCTWYDIEIGIAYSLSTVAEDLDGFDIQAIVEQMYNEANEPVTE
ncbi:MAG: hypothetical protein IK123_09590 [Lachnospiraceae bacterium]|nr:hypothetical protein [Lachnospiraceae bacterium]